MRIHFWDGEQKARLRKTQPPPECKNCNKPITYNNSRAWKDKKQPAKNVVTTHSLLNALHTSMHRPNYFSAFPNPLCLAAIRNLALKYFRLGGSRLITGLRCTFWFFSSLPAPPPPPSLLWVTLKHAPLEERLPSPSWGWSRQRIKQRTTQLNSVSFNEAGIFNVSPGLAHRIVAECNILDKKRCV